LLRTLNSIGLEHFPALAKFIWIAPSCSLLGPILAAGLFVGFFPIAGISSISVNDALHEDSRTGPQEKNLVASVNFLLLVKLDLHSRCSWAQACFWLAFRLLLQVDPGFNPNGVVTASVALPRSKYDKPELSRSFMNRALPPSALFPVSPLRRQRSRSPWRQSQ